MNYSLFLSPKMTFHGFQDAYLSLAPSYLPLGATLDECLILSALCIKLTISWLSAGLSLADLGRGIRRKDRKMGFIFAIILLFLILSLASLMSRSDSCREDSVYSHLYFLLIVIHMIGICRCLFLAIPGAISCSKQIKSGLFHHSLPHVESKRKECSRGEFQL